jgi:tetratricopeptide (TPR) repeat protein
MLRTARNKRSLFNDQEFPKEKSAGTYRIFCMGGSTTYGRPYFDNVSFCGWLRAYLQAADPTRNWEVINAGGISYASYRVARLMGELKQYQPDLFIVYSGQNEFLEQRSYSGLIDQPDWLINLNATLSGTRVYTALEELIKAVQPDSLQQAKARSQLSGEVDEILNHTAGPESYHRDDILKQQITTHYRMNLVRMVKIARSVDAGMVFIKPAINIRSMSPFKSEHRAGLDEVSLALWQAHYERGEALEAAGDAAGALASYREALALDDRHAGLHYRIGQALFALGHYGDAEQALRRAVEEDVAPLRILSAMQRDVAEVAAEEDVPLVDFPAILRAAYRKQYDHAVFGEEYFVDHVHTSKEGYRLLGLALLEELEQEGVINPGPGWNAARRARVEQAVFAHNDRRREGMSFVNLGRVLDWAGKYEEASVAFQRALKIMGPYPDAYNGLASSLYSLGKSEAAINYYKAMLVMAPAHRRGIHARLARIYAELGDTEQAIEQCLAELEIDRDNFRMHLALAELLEQQGDSEEAREQYRTVLQINNDFAAAHASFAHYLLRQGQEGEALEHSRLALQLDPEEVRAHTVLGLVLRQQGKTEQAIKQFSEVLRLEPGNSFAADNLRQLQSERIKTGSGDNIS